LPLLLLLCRPAARSRSHPSTAEANINTPTIHCVCAALMKTMVAQKSSYLIGALLMLLLGCVDLATGHA
jgi:hypothetical protein